MKDYINKYMRYIPKEYKNEVQYICTGTKEWNEYTKRWNIPIIVCWKDGSVNKYQNASYMQTKLCDFGRE